jgi:hypothetical protein
MLFFQQKKRGEESSRPILDTLSRKWVITERVLLWLNPSSRHTARMLSALTCSHGNWIEVEVSLTIAQWWGATVRLEPELAGCSHALGGCGYGSVAR